MAWGGPALLIGYTDDSLPTKDLTKGPQQEKESKKQNKTQQTTAKSQ